MNTRWTLLAVAGCLLIAGYLFFSNRAPEDTTPTAICPDAPPPPMSGSVAAVESFEQLVWASARIVTGTVTELCDEWGDAIVFDVDQTWRGEPIDRFVIVSLNRSLSRVAPYSPGDDLLMFLGRNDRLHYAVGESQGIFEIAGDNTVEFRQFPVQLSDVANQVATVLNNPPSGPSSMGAPYAPVSLKDAPPGPDLDAAR